VFVRFRYTGNRLQVSLVETHRVDGKVRHEHVASLGSVPLPPSIADRVAFWSRLHERLAKLSNRLGPDLHGKVLGDVHAKVPMPTADEQRTLQLDNQARSRHPGDYPRHARRNGRGPQTARHDGCQGDR
jgi:hypothetical protein